MAPAESYFLKYLKIAPFSHALWRGVEAQIIADACKEIANLPKKKSTNNSFNFKKPVLDVGCGFGEFSGIFFDSQVEVGVDISTDDLIRARQTKKYKKLFVTDARNMSFPDNIFSTVICISVIEHISKPELVLKEIYRVLKSGGFFILTVPTIVLNDNLFYPQLFTKIGLKGMAKWYITNFHKVFKHVNLFSTKKWVSLTTKSGLKIMTVQKKFPKFLTVLFDIALIFALPSQVTRWLFGKRAIWGGSVKLFILNKIYLQVLKDKNMTDSNILIIAQKP